MYHAFGSRWMDSGKRHHRDKTERLHRHRLATGIRTVAYHTYGLRLEFYRPRPHTVQTNQEDRVTSINEPDDIIIGHRRLDTVIVMGIPCTCGNRIDKLKLVH